MPGLSESFLANKSFTLVAAALAFLAAAVLVSVIFRVTFGRRLRLPRNGRARLPRLGTVDAFDLDRQRQLVIIRRDNVEHLLMIGGPNDLVIESHIIRAESRDPRDFREARLRDKELREKEARDAPPLPAGTSWPAPAESPSPGRKMPFPAAAVLEPEAGAMAGDGAEEASGFAPPTVLPVPRPPAFPMPPRRTPPPAAPSGQRISNYRESLHGRADLPQRPEPAASPAKDFRRASVATPFLRPSPHRQTEVSAVRLAPSAGFEAPAAIPTSGGSPYGIEDIPGPLDLNAAPVPSTAGADAPAFATDDVFQDSPVAETAQAGTDTLETEMAKLLGRGPA